MDPRVFILQKQNRYDISAVKFFSSKHIYIINNERISPFDTFSFIELIQHRLKVEEFNPEKDFICLTGSSVLLSLFLATIVRDCKFHDQFKVLIFDAKTSKYTLRILNLGCGGHRLGEQN